MSYPKHGDVLRMTASERVEYLDALEVEQRLEQMAKIPDEERTELIENLEIKTKMRWINEEREHLEEVVKDQPVEGADFGEDPDEVVIIPGAEEPQDRAPDVSEELIAELVKDKFNADRRASEAEALLDKYRAAFGELPS